MYTYSWNTATTAGALVGAALVLVVIAIIIGIAVGIFMLVCLWKIFKKAGKNGWEAIIPFYNSWTLVEIAGLNWYWFLIYIGAAILAATGITGLSLIGSAAGIFTSVVIYNNLCKKFHQDSAGFIVLLVLLPIVGYPMLAFSDKYQYDSDVEVNPNGFLGGSVANNNAAPKADTTAKTGTASKNTKFCTNCGTKVNKDVKFCTNCGTKLN